MKAAHVLLGFGLLALAVTLANWSLRHSTPANAKPTPASSPAEHAEPERNTQPPTRAGQQSQDRAIIDQLRARGASAKTLRTIARVLCLERHEQERARSANSPARWNARFFKPSPAQRAALAELDRTIAAEVAELLGPDVAAGAEGPALPGVPEAKRAAVLEIERDYFTARRTAGIGVGSKADAEIERRWREDLGKVLTPAELETHTAYSSARAQLLQQRLLGLDLTDAQYESVFRAFDRYTNENRERLGGLEFDRGVVDTIAATAGAVAALHFARQDNAGYAEVSDVWREASIAPQEELNRFKTYVEFHTELGGPAPLTNRMLGTAAQKYHALLTRGLTAGQVARFDRTSLGDALQRYMRQINDPD